jgi:hypothetical protein
MSPDEVRALLGEPEDVSAKNHPQIWKFGSLQFVFYNVPEDPGPFAASVTLFFINPDEHPPRPLTLSGWVPSAETSFEEFEQYIKNNSIEIVKKANSGPAKFLVLESGVRVTFDEDGRLFSISHSKKRESDLRQLAVKVRRSELELIKSLARGRGISATDLCSEWIKERVASLEKAPTS